MDENKGIFKTESGLKRIKTGVSGLNHLLEGGFPHPSVILLTGDSGAGKTIFSIQFLYNGVQKYDEPGLYLRVHGYDTDIEWVCLKSGLDMGSLQEEEKLVLTNYELSGFEEFDIKTEGRRIKKKIGRIVDSTGAKRVVIDSIAPFGHLSDSKSSYRAFIHSLAKEVKNLDCTALFVAEKTSQTQLTTFEVEQFISDGVVELRRKKSTRGKRNRVLYMPKMVATQTPSQGVPFNISDDGFKLLPSYYE